MTSDWRTFRSDVWRLFNEQHLSTYEIALELFQDEPNPGRLEYLVEAALHAERDERKQRGAA